MSYECIAEQFSIKLHEPFNLRNTLLSGQTFAWSCIPNEDLAEQMKEVTLSDRQGWYKLTDGEYVCLVTQVSKYDIVVFGQHGTGMYWRNYFRAQEAPVEGAKSIVLGPRRFQIGKDVSEKLGDIIEESGGRDGIRVLNQSPWSTVVEFIISQRNSLKRIHNQVLGMLQLGPKVTLVVKDENGEETRFSIGTMPSAEDLIKLADSGHTEKLDVIGLGYRQEYILATARGLVKDVKDLKCPNCYNVSELLMYLKWCKDHGTISSYKLLCYLEKFKGIGPKVSNCIALFGFGCRGVFPVDVWIQRMIDAGYVPENTDILGRHAGEIQQYLFWYAKRTH